MQLALDRALSDAEHRSDLADAALFEVEQHHDLSQRLRELRQVSIPLDAVGFRRRGRRLGNLLQGRGPAIRLRSERAETRVAGDRIQPRGDGGPAIVGGKRAPHLHEHVLRDFLGSTGVSQHRDGHAKDLLFVAAPSELRGRRRTAAAAAAAGHRHPSSDLIRASGVAGCETGSVHAVQPAAPRREYQGLKGRTSSMGDLAISHRRDRRRCRSRTFFRSGSGISAG